MDKFKENGVIVLVILSRWNRFTRLFSRHILVIIANCKYTMEHFPMNKTKISNGLVLLEVSQNKTILTEIKYQFRFSAPGNEKNSFSFTY